VSGKQNPAYLGAYVFDNDFGALLETGVSRSVSTRPFLQKSSIVGLCRVVCFSERHDLSLAKLGQTALKDVVLLWREQSRELGGRFKWVQVFENKGEIMGCSNPHPHGQIWAMSEVPSLPRREERGQKSYCRAHRENLLLAYAEFEVGQQQRVVCCNDDWLVVVPYWASWPFETLLLPRFPVQRLSEIPDGSTVSLAAILKDLLDRYDRLFDVEFPYTMGWHGAPFEKGDFSHWQLHAHYYPPLLRSATIRKFMVGFEMLSEPQRDISPEDAAAKLREAGLPSRT